jgi:uncharacterized cupredoxin-like copper-binding protein
MELFRQWGIEERVRATSIDVDFVSSIRLTLVGPEIQRMSLGYPDAELARTLGTTAPAARRGAAVRRTTRSAPSRRATMRCRRSAHKSASGEGGSRAAHPEHALYLSILSPRLPMLKVVPLLLFAGAAAFVTSSKLSDAPNARAAFKVPIVTVHAKEFTFVAPASIAAGQTTFRLVNDGQELHHLSIMRLAKGKTFADFEAALKSDGPPPTWITAVGGPNAAVPGKSVEATLTLEPGDYVIACFIPSPGEEKPHAMKGMYKPLTVVSGGVTQEGMATNTFGPTPQPDVHLELKDYGFTFSKPLTAGKHTFHVMNVAEQDHEVVLVRLAPGKHVSDFSSWAMTGMKGPPPAMPIDGMAAMGKGRTAIFTADLTPGTYGVVCFVSDMTDHKSHIEHGMTTEFTIAAK